MFMSFGPKAVEGGRESTHKKPGQSLGWENEDPNLGIVGDTSFLWSAVVRGQCACTKYSCFVCIPGSREHVFLMSLVASMSGLWLIC